MFATASRNMTSSGEKVRRSRQLTESTPNSRSRASIGTQAELTMPAAVSSGGAALAARPHLQLLPGLDPLGDLLDVAVVHHDASRVVAHGGGAVPHPDHPAVPAAQAFLESADHAVSLQDVPPVEPILRVVVQ